MFLSIRLPFSFCPPLPTALRGRFFVYGGRRGVRRLRLFGVLELHFHPVDECRRRDFVPHSWILSHPSQGMDFSLDSIAWYNNGVYRISPSRERMFLMDPTITSALVAFGTTMATKGAEAPAKTINLLWEAVFAPLNTRLENRILKYNESQQQYGQDIQECVKDIPPEYIQEEPDISLIGPALEASKYYIEKDVPRKMFARLIAASLDKRKEDTVHHAFVDIIKQMAPLDAKVLSVFDNPTSLLYCLIPTKDNPDVSNVISDIYISDNFPEYDNSVSLAVGNLARLGLIDIPTRNMSGVKINGNDTEAIERFKNTHFFESVEHDIHVSVSPDATCQITSYQAYLTALAFSFRAVCL